MNDISFILMKIVVSVSTALIAAYLVPLIRAKLADVKYARLVAAIKTAVEAAQQTISPEFGQVKKDYVVKIINNWMADHGIKITEEQLDQLIEAAVWQMKKGV